MSLPFTLAYPQCCAWRAGTARWERLLRNRFGGNSFLPRQRIQGTENLVDTLTLNYPIKMGESLKIIGLRSQK